MLICIKADGEQERKHVDNLTKYYFVYLIFISISKMLFVKCNTMPHVASTQALRKRSSAAGGGGGGSGGFN